MNISVSIYTPNEDVGCSVLISQMGDSNNYSYTIQGDDENGSFEAEGEIYNFQGSYFDLVREVLNGRTMSRKD